MKMTKSTIRINWPNEERRVAASITAAACRWIALRRADSIENFNSDSSWAHVVRLYLAWTMEFFAFSQQRNLIVAFVDEAKHNQWSVDALACRLASPAPTWQQFKQEVIVMLLFLKLFVFSYLFLSFYNTTWSSVTCTELAIRRAVTSVMSCHSDKRALHLFALKTHVVHRESLANRLIVSVKWKKDLWSPTRLWSWHCLVGRQCVSSAINWLSWDMQQCM